MLAHQIFRRRDFLGVLALLLVLGPGMGDKGNRCSSNSGSQEGAAGGRGQGHGAVSNQPRILGEAGRMPTFHHKVRRQG